MIPVRALDVVRGARDVFLWSRPSCPCLVFLCADRVLPMPIQCLENENLFLFRDQSKFSGTLARLMHSITSIPKLANRLCGQHILTRSPQRSKMIGLAQNKNKRTTLQAVCKTCLQYLLLDSFVIDSGHQQLLSHVCNITNLKSIVHVPIINTFLRTTDDSYCTD